MANGTAPISPQDVSMRSHGPFRRTYVWQWPIRIFHWVNAVSLTVLFCTGLYIAWPIFSPGGGAFNHFLMSTVRQVHFTFAFIFVINFLWRIYWFWVGNEYARSGFPFVWKKAWWRDLFRQAWQYLSLRRGFVHLGHNALSGVTYTFVIALGWAQIFTGFAMYGEIKPGGFFDSVFGWVIPLLGGSFQVHMWHYLVAWGFLVFAIVHIYVVLYDGQQYKNGLVTSMVSGVKFYHESDLDYDKPQK